MSRHPDRFFPPALPGVLAAALLAVSAAAQQAPARITIRATRGAEPFRPAIRAFVQDVQRELHYSIGLPFPPEDAPDLVVELGFARPFATVSGHRLLRAPRGRVKAVVVVPDADVADWGRLRFDIAAALFRRELHDRAKRGTPVTEPPVWLVRGIADLTDKAARGRSFEQAYGQWSRAKLDRADWLFRADSRASDMPCVAAQLAAWCADRPDRRQCWSNLLDALARGDAWTPALVASVFAGADSPAMLDDAFDVWMAARARRIFSPGTTSAGTLARMRLSLVVFQPEMEWQAHSSFDGKAFLPLSWYAENPGLPGAAGLLRSRASRLRLAAIGRDKSFQLLCSLYANALDAAAAKGWFYASAYWLAAEDLRADLEARIAAGETLGASDEEQN